MSLNESLHDILAKLQAHNLTISSFMSSVLRKSNTDTPISLTCDNVLQIANDLHSYDPNIIFSWVFDLVLLKLQTELSTLSQWDHGFHFNAKNASSTYLEGSFMGKAAEKMKVVSPWTWRMMQEVLHANRHSHPPHCDQEDSIRSLASRQADKEGHKLGDTLIHPTDGSAVAEDESQSQKKKRRKAEQTEAWNAALDIIVSHLYTM